MRFERPNAVKPRIGLKIELSLMATAKRELSDRLHSLYMDKLTGVVPLSIYSELKLQWETELSGVESVIAAFGTTRRRYEEECLSLMDFASNAYSRFKEADREDQREMAKNLLSNATITDGNIQVFLHSGFEMILEANAEMESDPAKSRVVEIWLPD